MTKKEFVAFMERLVELKEIEHDIIISFAMLGDLNQFSLGKAIDLITDMLKHAMKDDTDWISYWLYELDYGKNTKLKVTKNGKRIPMKTPANLYDCIIQK